MRPVHILKSLEYAVLAAFWTVLGHLVCQKGKDQDAIHICWGFPVSNTEKRLTAFLTISYSYFSSLCLSFFADSDSN